MYIIIIIIIIIIGKQDARRDVKLRVALGDWASARGDGLARQQAQRARDRAQQAFFFF